MQKQTQSKRWRARGSKSILALTLACMAGVASQAADVLVTGLLKREFFAGATRAGITDGTVTTPTSVGAITAFDAPAGVADNYSQRISGFFIPETTGNYIFFVAADDDADLYLSTDENPANKVLIANEVQWSNQRGWLNTGDGSDNAGDPTVKRSDNSVGLLRLTAGKRYYIEGIHHEGGGGDNFAATFKLEGQDDPANGSASRLTGNLIAATLPSGSVTITTQPSNVSTIEGVTATFTVAVNSTGIVAPAFQWRKNGADISGATSSSYTTPLLALSDSGSKYSVRIVVPGAEAVSTEVTLTVASDTLAPTIVSAGGIRKGNGVEVGLIFNEALTESSVIAANFSLSAGAVTGARYIPNSSGVKSLERGVVLSTTGLTPGSSYTVTVKNVADAKGNKISTATADFKVSTMTWAALGNENPSFPASAIAVGDNGFNVNSGGNAFWNTTDDVTFVYEEITGDFDKVARVEYQDASSQWARAGLHARESLAALVEEASRYQQVHVNPSIKADGGASNNSWETNRRLDKGGATSSSTGGGPLTYPDGWVRLRRTGDIIHMYRSNDGVTWYEFDATNFNPPDGSRPDGPLAAKMFVGMVFGPENGNLPEAFRSNWAVRFRDYGDMKPNKGRGSAPYSIGVHFEDNDVASTLGPKEVAGVDSIAQSNWNNTPGIAKSEAPMDLIADVNGVATSSSAKIEWDCPNTWNSTGRGEENNQFVGSDWNLMKGYLDTGNATTTKATITGIPSQLTGAAGGYDVIIYALGGVPARGGSYKVTDQNGTELAPTQLMIAGTNPSAFKKVVQTDASVHGEGNYLVFKGLKAGAIIVEASTETGPAGGTPRAPLNAIQLVPSGLVDVVKSNPTISIAKSAAGPVITFTGTLQKASTVKGPYTDVAGATSPRTVTPSDAEAYYRTK